MNKFVFLSDDKKVINVLSIAKTKNKKISDGKNFIAQTYHFDVDQFNYIKNGGNSVKVSDGFISPKFTSSNCGNCPLRFGGCYTFKFVQVSGNKKMLQSIVNIYGNIENIPVFNENISDLILSKIDKKNVKYIRFGSYGCPTNLNINLVKQLTNKVNTWTGYTHEWHNKDKKEYLDYFMASSHNDGKFSNFASQLANLYGFRTFETDSNNGIECPNNKNKKVTCEKCGLCSGKIGKGKTNINIPTH
jgi:hypothetical protein